MIEKKHKKTFRLSSKDYSKLKELSRKTKLSEADVIRMMINNTELKESPPKEFYDLLNKINNIGNNINQIAKIANQTGEIYYRELTLFMTSVNTFISECRNKYL